MSRCDFSVTEAHDWWERWKIRGPHGPLSQQLHDPVSDLTGLNGSYDFALEWKQDDNVPGPSLFTAVQEQLGLKLEPKKSPMEILVIDHAEKIPVAN